MREKYIKVFLLLLIITFVFYGKSLLTWFQQDEWSIFGRLAFLNTKNTIPGLGAFSTFLFPHPRFTFSPFYFALYSVLNHFFGINFTPYMLLSLTIHSINAFLVFFLVKKINKNEKTALLSAIIFASYSIGQKSVTWILSSINVGLATSFSLFSLIFFPNLIAFFLFLFVALWFSEQTMVIFIIFPILVLINKKSVKHIGYLVLFFFLYITARLLLSQVGNRINQDFIELPKLLKSSEYLIIALWAPIRSIVDIFFTPDSLYRLSEIATPIIQPELAAIKNTTTFDLFTQTAGVDLITILLLIPITSILCFFYRSLKTGFNKKLFLAGFTFIISSILISLLLTIRGKATLELHIMRSRDLYLASVGAAMILALILERLWKKWRIVATILSASFLFYHWSYINRVILTEEIQKANQRRSIVTQIYTTYPNLPKKVIFYTESDTPYYGSTVPSMPFQTGFGRTLLVWYWYKNKNFPSKFMKDDFLYLPHSEGYKEIDGFGFGYFTDFTKMQTKMREVSLDPEDILAFSWSEKRNLLKNITQDTQERLR